MPYVNKEKQRAFQREWVRRKKGISADGSPRDTARRTIKWSELQDCDYAKIRKIETFEECVTEAKSTVMITTRNRASYRLKIAALCMRACEIRWGGKIRKDGDQDFYLTLNDFAKRIGVNKKSLGEWVAIRKRIYDELPPETIRTEGFDWASAQLCMRRSRKGDVNLVARYNQFIKVPGVKSGAHLLISVMGLSSSLKKGRLRECSSETRGEFFAHWNSCVKSVKAYKKNELQ